MMTYCQLSDFPVRLKQHHTSYNQSYSSYNCYVVDRNYIVCLPLVSIAVCALMSSTAQVHIIRTSVSGLFESVRKDWLKFLKGRSARKLTYQESSTREGRRMRWQKDVKLIE